ncbi:MAG: tetratricopeptide repeat protein [Verrucomicrobia bacterium]|nr:tetratricopeptide repeat protein [Verrucomicrobiota bacterium]
MPTLAERAESSYANDPGESIEYMKEIKGRLTGAMSEEYRGIYKENLYRLGLAHMLWYQQDGNPEHLEAGIPYWSEFINEFLKDPRHPLAMLNRADSYYGSEQWNEAVRAYRHVLEIYTLQLEPDELLGLLQRLVDAAAEGEDTESIEATLWRFMHSDFPAKVRLFCLNALFDEALASEGVEDLMRIVAEINRERTFRYDLGINLRLLSAGDRFEEEERYLEAGLLFSMVLPIERLLNSVEDALIEVEERLFRKQYLASNRDALESNRDALREQRARLVEAPRYTANLRWRQARVLQLMGRSYESFFAFKSLIEEFPQHKHVEQFRYAGFLQGLACRYYADAVVMGEAYLNEPAFVLYEKPIAVRLAQLYERSGDIDKLAPLADEFLNRFPYEPVASQMAHWLGQGLFREGKAEEILRTFPDWAAAFPDGVFIDAVFYWSGMAYLFDGDFERALRSFESVIEAHPGSVYLMESRFRRGVAYFGMGDYASARKIFTEWIGLVSEHPLLPEAHVFMGDLDAMDAQVESALSHYREVETLNGSQGLIDHAYFESASLLVANKRFAEHSELLERYLTRYPDSPSAADAVLRLARVDIELGRIESAFGHYRKGIESFGNRTESDHVDQLIDAWWKTDTEIRMRAKQVADFLRRFMSDESFRSEMLFDRVGQIQYLSAHPQIPEDLGALLSPRSKIFEQLAKRTAKGPAMKDRVLKLEDYEPLLRIHREVKRALEQLPEKLPGKVFAEMYEEAVAADETALSLRLLRVLNLRTGRKVDPGKFGEDAFDQASPMTLVWIAGLMRETDPQKARSLLNQVIERGSTSASASEALFALGELEWQTSNFMAASEYFGRIVADFFNHERAPEAAMLQGDALRQGGKFTAAIESYTMILNQRDWRGRIWAEATFKVGLCFLELDELGKAQGFFERTYLAYRGYPHWAAEAAVASGKLLERLGDLESARRTYQSFLDLPDAEESSHYGAVLRRIENLNQSDYVEAGS